MGPEACGNAQVERLCELGECSCRRSSRTRPAENVAVFTRHFTEVVIAFCRTTSVAAAPGMLGVSASRRERSAR